MSSTTLVFALLLGAILGENEPPENVLKWQTACAQGRERMISFGENSVALAKKRLKNTEPKDRKKNLEAVKTAEASLKAIKERPATDFVVEVQMLIKPELESIGYVSSCRVVKVIDQTSAIVELQSFTYNAMGGVTGTVKGKVILSGLDTSRWPNDSNVDIKQTFIASEIDATQNRMVVLKPFDTKKWATEVTVETKKPSSKK